MVLKFDCQASSRAHEELKPFNVYLWHWLLHTRIPTNEMHCYRGTHGEAWKWRVSAGDSDKPETRDVAWCFASAAFTSN